jgi:hypothetical protein
VQADLRFIATNIPPQGLTSRVGVFRDITQAPLATADATLMPPPVGTNEATVSFLFDPPVPLQPGTQYTLGWYGNPGTNGAVMSWEFTFQNAYANGQVVDSSNVPLNPPADFAFTTYYAP